MDDPKKNIEERISQILDAFKIYDGVYKKEQIDAAIELKAEITPHLIKILQGVLDNPEKYRENQELQDHIYALMLLGYFKEPTVHQLLIDIFSLPDPIPYELYNDICTENLPIILFNTCDESTEQIKSLVLNKNADEYIRSSAARALTYAVVTEHIDRKDVLDFFCSLFKGDEAEKGSDFWGLLSNAVLDLYPDEHLDVIKNAFLDGLISPGLMDFEYFERTLNNRKENPLEFLRNDYSTNSLDDLHASMSWWACFQDSKEPSNHSSNAVQQLKAQKIANKKKASAKKKKRNQAKKSRKKNRR